MIDNITLDNLHIGCKASNKAEVIAMIGEEFKAKGYVNQECVHFLLEREHQVSTFLGNGITLPHLPKSATDIILKTGIEIYQFPDGVIWDRSNVMFIAIGVIAKEKEHIDVLKEIASIFSDELIAKEGANKQVISSQADSLIKISRIWADFFPANTSNQPI
ncbi:TPA: PTS sugar transporter subunit IIA [Klebsiella pneumoniae]|uniref:PTS sugar transporter subunit IIA n=2 Tax=Klebsiella pneumoniae TaxID=573 RepID=UPI00307623A3|nr:PTS sugar transporter subunit IIA [Klebsiella pneumoniae]HBQ2906442.1 PTS sugar transporter subunit IIA [Klebsiella pneumoniae]